MADQPKTIRVRRSAHEPDHECGALTRAGFGCLQPAGHKTSHPGGGRCWLHLGTTPNGVAAGQRQLAEQALRTYGIHVEIHPEEAMLDELARAYGAVLWLEESIGALDPGAIVSGVREIRERRGPGTADRAGAILERTSIVASVPAVLIQLYLKERKHYFAVASDCVRLGLEARKIDAQERWGAMVASVMAGVLEDLGIQRGPEVDAAVARRLRAV